MNKVPIWFSKLKVCFLSSEVQVQLLFMQLQLHFFLKTHIWLFTFLNKIWLNIASGNKLKLLDFLVKI